MLDQVDESLKVIASTTLDKTMRKLLSSTDKMKVIVNKTMGLDLVNMTKKHINYMTFICFKKSIPKMKDANLRKHMENLCVLAGIYFFKNTMAEGYDCGYFKPGDQNLVEEAYKLVLKKIRPQAIPLAELACVPDEIMQTAIGNSYGDIYETHFRWA